MAFADFYDKHFAGVEIILLLGIELSVAKERIKLREFINRIPFVLLGHRLQVKIWFVDMQIFILRHMVRGEKEE